MSRIVFYEAASLAAVLLWGAIALAQKPPDDLVSEIGIDQRVGAAVPLDLPLVNESGSIVRLGDCLDQNPAILLLCYYTCPRLCPLVIEHLVESLTTPSINS